MYSIFCEAVCARVCMWARVVKCNTHTHAHGVTVYCIAVTQSCIEIPFILRSYCSFLPSLFIHSVCALLSFGRWADNLLCASYNLFYPTVLDRINSGCVVFDSICVWFSVCCCAIVRLNCPCVFARHVVYVCLCVFVQYRRPNQQQWLSAMTIVFDWNYNSIKWSCSNKSNKRTKDHEHFKIDRRNVIQTFE